MKISKAKIWIRFFFKSFIWLILPICIFGNIESCQSYIDAGSHLTPYSVSVSGYYRSNGTYVRPYKRRPSGGVNHDEPYISERMTMGLLFFVCLIGGGGSIIIYARMSISEIENQRKIIKEIEYKKRIEDERQQKILKEFENFKREEERQYSINEILNTINYNFSELTIIPQNLKRGSSSKCKFCMKYISKDDFYVSFKAVSRIHIVCMNCLKKLDSIGKNQPKSKYLNEIKYYDCYFDILSEFKTKFIEKLNSYDFTLRDIDLKRIFDSEIKKKSC